MIFGTLGSESITIILQMAPLRAQTGKNFCMTACHEVNVYIKRELRMNMMNRLTAYVSGKVQKTGYRARVITIAQHFKLNGYVQNLEDGRVKVVAEGENIDLEILLRALDIKDTLIHVVNIKKEYSSVTGDFEGFFKVISDEDETDQRLDVAVEKLAELIIVNNEILKRLRATREDLKNEIEDLRSEMKEILTRG
jgi:acylphosphatase